MIEVCLIIIGMYLGLLAAEKKLLTFSKAISPFTHVFNLVKKTNDDRKNKSNNEKEKKEDVYRPDGFTKDSEDKQGS